MVGYSRLIQADEAGTLAALKTRRGRSPTRTRLPTRTNRRRAQPSKNTSSSLSTRPRGAVSFFASDGYKFRNCLDLRNTHSGVSSSPLKRRVTFDASTATISGQLDATSESGHCAVIVRPTALEEYLSDKPGSPSFVRR